MVWHVPLPSSPRWAPATQMSLALPVPPSQVASLWPGAGVCVGITAGPWDPSWAPGSPAQHGLPGMRGVRGPGAHSHPLRSDTWAPPPRLKARPRFCSFGFSRTLLFPGKPGNHSGRFSLCLPLFHPGSRVLSGLRPAGSTSPSPPAAHFWVMTPALGPAPAPGPFWPRAPRGCHLVATSGVTGFPRGCGPAPRTGSPPPSSFSH